MNIFQFILGLFTSAPKDDHEPIFGISDKGLQIIKDHEQLRLVAYLPTPRDVWTIGWGHTRTAKPGMKITEDQATRLLRDDLDWVEKALADLVKVPLTQNQYDALASFIFNIGRPQFEKSTLLKLLNAKDYQGAADQFPRWDKQKGRVLNGLVKRRKQERQLFLS